MHYQRKTFAINPNIDTISMNAAYTQYADVIGNVYDRTLSKIERAGMAAVYGNPSPLPSAVVTNTKDSGPGSLRTAIYYAFDKSTDPSPVATIVTFNIPTSDPGYNSSTGIFTIKPTFSLPALGNGTTIDGTSQTSFTGNTNVNGPEIALDGANFAVLGADPFNLFSPGLTLRAANCTIKGLIIQNFNEWGINLLQGVDPNGSATTGNIIGGTTASARNIISGNAYYGVAISGPTTTANVIEGNYIGTDQSGSTPQPNAFGGIEIYSGAHSNTTGGATSSTRNVISGNNGDGIQIRDAATQSNVIQGNFIGLNFDGSTALPNQFAGIEIYGGAPFTIIGGSSSGAGNIISGNVLNGVIINGSNGTQIQGNLIGLDVGGTTARANGGAGVYMFAGAQNTTVGGTTSGASLPGTAAMESI